MRWTNTGFKLTAEALFALGSAESWAQFYKLCFGHKASQTYRSVCVNQQVAFALLRLKEKGNKSHSKAQDRNNY